MGCYLLGYGYTLHTANGPNHTDALKGKGTMAKPIIINKEVMDTPMQGVYDFSFAVTLNDSEQRAALKKEGKSADEIKKIMKEKEHLVSLSLDLEGYTLGEIMQEAAKSFAIQARPGYYKAPSDNALASYVKDGPIEVNKKSLSETPWHTPRSSDSTAKKKVEKTVDGMDDIEALLELQKKIEEKMKALKG